MSNETLILVLALFTLGAAIGYGLWQRARTRRSQAEGHKSAMTTSAEAKSGERR
jgi:hypothetical protein